MANLINWFEIPATDFDRATAFYSNILGAEVNKQDWGEAKMGFLPMEGEGVGGAIVHYDGCTPGSTGPSIYLNGGEDLSGVLSRVESAGGKILQPKTIVNEEIGYWAKFEDSEGNHICLHSPK